MADNKIEQGEKALKILKEMVRCMTGSCIKVA